MKMESGMVYENDLINLKATELRLGLPGTDRETEITHHHGKALSSSSSGIGKKRHSSDIDHAATADQEDDQSAPPPAKTQIVGWPPIRAYRKNSLIINQQQNKDNTKKNKKSSNTNGNDQGSSSDHQNMMTIGGIFVKVSMDGAPYLRKIDLSVYKAYPQLLKALEDMFKFTVGQYSEREGYKGSDFVPTYEDKDGDWMLVGDVPWEMFMSSCKKLRIMKESEARGLGCGV
ncbi:hypothetical protein F8388_003419 [Cannabis sativa]|uniref:Auxin-responsive protein n=1 Tax=Cannabis sativa TaxID=3483 RepID=A0A7J6H251_CANSA|nr:hypothetical protein G4B88_014944 [Cannabis sativa]KAF4365750.1 hypothetical protein F8388_003419 [Cannabis sativa]KAF4389306.1 hypothetical protein G4B88_003119 [Cannabis sativa]